ncbi:inositol polyphosphate 5-phosphatase II [Phakopsora pachyrhizi]|uniref:Inositol polyphosphate 5-phosphatase II n=1 Tax=Phakopsora pachyrhizi TaxID=170000 RepID=A0AAV0BVP2_PHAPC|nr:inositol polyphosphate 5-phosphatase II [Phakopsora pachyrhizi]
MKIRCMTYNLNRGKVDEDFSKLVYNDDEDIKDREEDDKKTDLYIFSFQLRELAPLHLALSNLTQQHLTQRVNRISKILNSNNRDDSDHRSMDKSTSSIDSYDLIVSTRHGGLALLIYLRQNNQFGKLSRVENSSTSFGCFDLMNNKGALGARLTFKTGDEKTSVNLRESITSDKTVLTFVNAHLAAHDSGLEARSRNYQSLISRMLFRSDENTYSIYDSNLLFFMGDLNYRISLVPNTSKVIKVPHLKSSSLPESLSKSQVQHLLLADKHLDLIDYHETLKHQHSDQKVLVGLNEGPISFKPTYKYQIGTVDQFVSFDHRLPDYSQSDHKPVYGTFLIKIRPNFENDKNLIIKGLIGNLLDKSVGYLMVSVIIIGFGNFKVGILNTLVLIISWKFLTL